jgi:putative Mg2+ transporter-C (MgtC) family protein
MYGFQGLGVNNSGGEPARLAAQVVSGIGFLGAGTILRNGNNIRGLTTAASIWVCGGIGLAIGNGYYLGGIATTIIVLFSLRGLGFIQKKIFKNQYKLLIVQCKERAGLIGDIGIILGKSNISIKDIKVDSEDNIGEEEGHMIEIKFMVQLPPKLTNEGFLDEILQVHGVETATWKGDIEKAYLF